MGTSSSNDVTAGMNSSAGEGSEDGRNVDMLKLLEIGFATARHQLPLPPSPTSTSSNVAKGGRRQRWWRRCWWSFLCPLSPPPTSTHFQQHCRRRRRRWQRWIEKPPTSPLPPLPPATSGNIAGGGGEAILYAENLKLTRDGKDVWIFDIDETILSNLPYYARHGFGVEPFNSTLFNEWVNTGEAPPLPESLRLYRKLLSLGLKIVFLTGRSEDQRKATSTNLKKAGFHTWEKLILKKSSNQGTTAVVYKSGERKTLEESGYRIVGNIGDQWSDILGNNTGNRTFKLPDPMYYLS
ncbi:PREDICTED: acid phosphatase 1-like [Nelumbo nucifera]|uniref:Acid phosphatase 1-like n=1 Tax=Nelumbo nucifera TaxID=4432 RepID=A0A1U8A9K5_NELNU|nr:PREDICTED: acid phosphatase 1-like [Nelumbo nucifera]